MKSLARSLEKVPAKRERREKKKHRELACCVFCNRSRYDHQHRSNAVAPSANFSDLLVLRPSNHVLLSSFVCFIKSAVISDYRHAE